MKKYYLVPLILVLFLLGAGCAKSSFKKVEVNNWLEDYYVDIPTGNSSTCIWRYAQGSASVPYTKTTNAKTSQEKHTITIVGVFQNADVNCLNDLGNNYQAEFKYNHSNKYDEATSQDDLNQENWDW